MRPGQGSGARSGRSRTGPAWGSRPSPTIGSTALIEDLYLVAGDHLLTVGADGEYSLALTSLGPPDLAAEREPNDDPDHAAPDRGRRRAHGAATGGRGRGRLPLLAVGTGARHRDRHAARGWLDRPRGHISQDEPGPGRRVRCRPARRVRRHATAGSDHQIWLRPSAPSTGAYSIRLDRGDPFTSGADGGAPGARRDARAHRRRSEVAAFWRDGQRVEATLRVANSGSNDLPLDLDAATSHHAWSVELPAEVEVAPGGTRRRPADHPRARGRVARHPGPRHRARQRMPQAPRAQPSSRSRLGRDVSPGRPAAGLVGARRAAGRAGRGLGGARCRADRHRTSTRRTSTTACPSPDSGSATASRTGPSPWAWTWPATS